MLKQFRNVTGFVITSLLITFSYAIQAATDCHSQQILTSKSCIGDDVDSEESKLHQLVNEYRGQYGLSAIPLSPSLSLVANRHVRDLHENIGYLTHGWSNCPYDASNSDTHPCMWQAPQRFGTSYTGNGFENAIGASNGYQATATSSLEGWKNSSSHNAVILNKGIWNKYPWNALGVGIYKGYAVLWFGKEVDPVQTTSTPQPIQTPNATGISVEYMSNAIFNIIERDYAEYFSPKSATQVFYDVSEVIYIRSYDNWYQAELATYQGDLWYALFNEWNRFGTLEEANQALCNNQCWTKEIDFQFTQF